MKAETKIGIVVKSFQKDSRPVNFGIKRGISMLPSVNLTIAMPAVITTNTIANPTDNAEVYLSESDTLRVTREEQISNYLMNVDHYLVYANIMCTNINKSSILG